MVIVSLFEESISQSLPFYLTHPQFSLRIRYPRNSMPHTPSRAVREPRGNRHRHRLGVSSDLESWTGSHIVIEEPRVRNCGPRRHVPVGLCLYYIIYSSWRTIGSIWIEDLFIRNECRGRGYGIRLMAECAKEVREKYPDGGRLEWSVKVWNEPAITF